MSVPLRVAEVHLDGELLAEFRRHLGVGGDGLVHVLEVVEREQRPGLAGGEVDEVLGAQFEVDIVGMADSDQLVHLELDEETRKLHISLDGLEYTLALIDPDSIRQEPDLPDLDLSAEIVVEGRDIDRAVTAADMVSDHIALGVDPDDEEFYVDAEGDTDDVHLELGTEDLIDLTAGEARSLFSLDYLKDMDKAIPSDAEVTTELGEEFPVKMHFGYAEGDGHVTFMLAPRIQSE